jgi:phage terminase large subunit-like protein
MIPGRQIVRIVPQPGVPDGVELVEVKHASGKVSRLGFKSFDQGRVSFQGTEQDFVWLDEEPPPDVYEECLTRTMTTGGLLLLTFTPLSGLSDVVMMFLPGGDIREQADEKSGRFVVMATWDDVPHLDERTKEMLFASYMPFQRDARTRGVPALGSGAIYPVPESDIVVPDFALAEHWPRCYGMDVGWNRTAAIWGALDRETGTTYLYSQHYRGEAEPIVHAQAIKNRGEWIPGAIDPASRGQVAERRPAAHGFVLRHGARSWRQRITRSSQASTTRGRFSLRASSRCLRAARTGSTSTGFIVETTRGAW